MDSLVKTALVGTGRTAETAPTGSPVDDLLRRADIAEPERALLLAAGAWAVWRLAGRKPALLPEPPEAAPEETRPVCAPRAAELLEQMLDGPWRALLPESCELLAAAGQRLPPALLPAALGLPKTYRVAVRPVLGERGAWLARQEPAWRWAAGPALGPEPEEGEEETVPADAERLWDEGSFETREALLRRVRRVDPARGRAWLEAGLSKEKADRRAVLVEALAAGLGPEDEPLLDKSLDDRSQQVRTAAGLLLARIPGSAYARRLQERADALLSWEAPKAAGLLGKVGALLESGKGRGRLLVEPPQEVDKSWERDGIPASPPQGVGKRAFWLTHVLARVPPRHWEERFGASPAELIAAARETDWLGPLAEGWARAALAFGAGSWIGPLWDLGREKKAPAELRPLLPELLVAVPEGEREERIARLLENPPPPDEAPLELYLRQLPRPWQLPFALRYLDLARSAAGTVAQGVRRLSVDPWLGTLPLAAVALPPESFEAALAPWPFDQLEAGQLETPDWFQRSWIGKIQELTEVVHIRRTLRKEIAP
jgi:hypothetical protein